MVLGRGRGLKNDLRMNNSFQVMPKRVHISNAIYSLQSKYVKRAHINSNFQLDFGNCTSNFIRKLEISNSNSNFQGEIQPDV